MSILSFVKGESLVQKRGAELHLEAVDTRM